jgi:hypothetical protein
MIVAPPLIFIIVNLTPSAILPPGFHSQMLFFVATTYYRRLLIRSARVWGCIQSFAALFRPKYGLNLLVLRYHFEFSSLFQEFASVYPL